MALATHQQAAIRMMFVTLFWGAFFISGKQAVHYVPAMSLAFLRFLAASCVLWPIILIREPSSFTLKKSDIPLLLAIGATGVAGYNVLAFMGLQLAPSSDGAMISPSLNPILSTLLAAYFLKEKLTSQKWLGLTLSSVGVMCIFAGPFFSADFTSTRLAGDGLFLLSAICWAVYTLLGKLAVGRFTPLASAAYASTVGAILLLPLAIRELVAINWGVLPLVFWGHLWVLSCLSTVGAFLLWFDAIRLVGVSQTASFIPLVPCFGVVLSMIFLGDRPSPLQFVGLAIAIVGVVVGNRTRAQLK
jgi:drug/metabolite transporter (DMT)-like permease